MKDARNNGAVLSLVIVGLALVAVVMFVLTEGTNTMLFQADRAYVQAVQRNLTASGLAWSRIAVADINDDSAIEPVQLDVAGLAAPGAALVVRVMDVRENEATVDIQSSCAKGKHELTRSGTHTIKLR